MRHFNPFFRFGRLAALATIVAVSFSACNTDDDDDTPPDSSGGTPTPQINAGHGTLVAAKTVTTIDPGFGVPPQDIDYGIGVAVFFNGTDYQTYISGGDVTCEDEALSQFDNGTYSTYSQTSTTGLDFSGDPSWTVSGNGDIPAFTHTADRGFPGISKITSPDVVTRSAGYTVTFQGNMSNTDSVIWVVGSKQFATTVAMNSRTFTADELSDLTAGAGNIIQVAAYNLDSAVYGGKTFYFINEKVVTKTVTVE
ncbi:MAG: hypothetical protein K9J06_05015 [Flavobacteriales bacterium]|nr:hypothetical protein [Flavobacteriales bacterium]